MADAAQILKRGEALETLRRPHERVWKDCFDHSFPIRSNGLMGDVIDADRAQRKKADLVDDTATDAATILASSFMGGMTPPNSLWSQYFVEDGDPAGDEWLDEASKRIFQLIHTSGYDASGLECTLDDVAAGWSVLYIDEDEERGGFHFECWPIGECYVTATRKSEPVDTIRRKFKLTASQAMDEYGAESLSEQTRKLAGEKPDEMVDFELLIYPRVDWIPGSRFARNLPFGACHVECRAKKIVRELGYHEFPCVVPRWQLIPASHYAIGPMFNVLPSARRLNEIARMELAAMDLAISGMWIAENDGVLSPRMIKIGPRKVIVANSVDSMKELKSGADFNASFTKSEQLQAQIRKGLMADQLQPQDGPAMTATEVHARMALLRQLLGPNYGRYQAEKLQPMLMRCFGIAFRNGYLGNPPDSIAGQVLRVRYISPLARSQRLEDVSAMDQFETVLATQMQFDPSAGDVYDWDESRRERSKLVGVPQKLIRKPEDVERIREDKRKAQQEAEQRAMQQQSAMAMADAGAQRIAKAA
jgi:hypothetical protein